VRYSRSSDPQCTFNLRAKFLVDRFLLSPSGGEKKEQFLPFFCISAFSGVAIWRQSDKVEHGCTPRTFPYPTASKLFLYSNAFVAKSGAQTLDVQKREGRTKRQTDWQTKKTQRFWPPRRRVKSEPHQTWHGDIQPQARSCTSKTFEGSDA